VQQRVYQTEVNDVDEQKQSDRCLGRHGTKRYQQLKWWMVQTSLCVCLRQMKIFSSF